MLRNKRAQERLIARGVHPRSLKVKQANRLMKHNRKVDLSRQKTRDLNAHKFEIFTWFRCQLFYALYNHTPDQATFPLSTSSSDVFNLQRGLHFLKRKVNKADKNKCENTTDYSLESELSDQEDALCAHSYCKVPEQNPFEARIEHNRLHAMSFQLSELPLELSIPLTPFQLEVLTCYYIHRYLFSLLKQKVSTKQVVSYYAELFTVEYTALAPFLGVQHGHFMDLYYLLSNNIKSSALSSDNTRGINCKANHNGKSHMKRFEVPDLTSEETFYAFLFQWDGSMRGMNGIPTVSVKFSEDAYYRSFFSLKDGSATYLPPTFVLSHLMERTQWPVGPHVSYIIPNVLPIEIVYDLVETKKRKYSPTRKNSEKLIQFYQSELNRLMHSTTDKGKITEIGVDIITDASRLTSVPELYTAPSQVNTHPPTFNSIKSDKLIDLKLYNKQRKQINRINNNKIKLLQALSEARSK